MNLLLNAMLAKKKKKSIDGLKRMALKTESSQRNFTQRFLC